MLRDLNKPVLAATLSFAALWAAPAIADVKTGVEAWSHGDYALAVREWEGPAVNGDADAQFNLGQAYRLGRGVPVDPRRAEDLYARAAAAGHLRAADTYGLLLFQSGRREVALPYVQDAARRGDPRAQYLLGIAYFNGDILGRDWVRAYALLALANGEGLPQAAAALSEMDGEIPLDQRRQAAGLAVQLREEAEAARASELTAADLGTRLADSGVPAADVTTIARASAPPVAATRTALAEATHATGTENPGEAGAAFALRQQAAPAEEPTPVARRVARPVVVSVLDAPPEPPKAAPVPAHVAEPVLPASAPVPAPARAASGPWRVQLGAFAVPGNAERLWSSLSGRAELAGKQRLMIPSGRVTLLMADGFATQSAANHACRALKQSGHDCLVTQR